MVEVCLVNPKSFNVLPSYLPYGILYIAGFLRSNGIKVSIYDANTFDEDFLTFIRRGKPRIVGISILSGPCLVDAVSKARIVRQYFPKTKIVFGGIHATLFPEDVLKQDYVDYIIMNEGEYAMRELTDYLLKRRGRLESMKNVGYKKNSKVCLNPVRNFIDLNSLPLPAWDLLPIEKYIQKKFYASRVITLHTSRGCPWDCAYCYNRVVNKRRWRCISAEGILVQIEYLIKNYEINGIQFYDDEFDVDTRRVMEFCNLLINKKIKIRWGHYSRTNVANEERFALEKEAGCEFIEFGVESGSSKILKMLQKQQTIKDIKKAFEICHKVGIKAGAMFMIGLPKETKEEIEMTIRLIKSLKAYQTICTIYHPYPGSELFNYCVKKGLFRLPEKLENQGKYFDIGNAVINVSNLDNDFLQSVQSMFAFNNIFQEVRESLKDGNFSMLFEHIKSRTNVINICLLFNGARSYLLSKFSEKKLLTDR